MKVGLKMVLLSGMCALLLGGCDNSGKAMPLTRESLSDYQQKVQAAVKSTSAKEFAETSGNPESQKKVMYRCFIQPVEQMGYSYDRTIAALAGKLLAKNLATPDTATTVMLSNMLSFAKNARETEYRHGFISGATKTLLDRVSLIFPR